MVCELIPQQRHYQAMRGDTGIPPTWEDGISLLLGWQLEIPPSVNGLGQLVSRVYHNAIVRLCTGVNGLSPSIMPRLLDILKSMMS